MRELCAACVGIIGSAFGYATSGVDGAIAGFLFFALFGVLVAGLFLRPAGDDW